MVPAFRKKPMVYSARDGERAERRSTTKKEIISCRWKGSTGRGMGKEGETLRSGPRSGPEASSFVAF